jgi:hypothetical protein
MCTPHLLFSLVLATVFTACAGGGLTLPDDSSPAALRAVSGDGQQGTVGSMLDEPLVVRLTDASARPIAGVPIVFEFTSDVPAAQVDPEQGETNSEGVASAEVRLGSETGSHQVEARVVSGAELSATFVVTAVEREPGKKNKDGEGGHGEDDDDDD